MHVAMIGIVYVNIKCVYKYFDGFLGGIYKKNKTWFFKGLHNYIMVACLLQV